MRFVPQAHNLAVVLYFLEQKLYFFKLYRTLNFFIVLKRQNTISLININKNHQRLNFKYLIFKVKIRIINIIIFLQFHKQKMIYKYKQIYNNKRKHQMQYILHCRLNCLITRNLIGMQKKIKTIISFGQKILQLKNNGSISLINIIN